MSPNTAKLVEGEGLPYDNTMPLSVSNDDRRVARQNAGVRGDLYIVFHICFPKQLTKEQKEQVAEALS